MYTRNLLWIQTQSVTHRAYIVWNDYDGTMLEDGYVYYGETPVYTGPAPTRTGYIFEGWTPAPGPVYGDTVYTATYEPIPVGPGGIFWKPSDGLISISDDGDTWLTMQDKNVGATQVFEFDDQIFTSATCGIYYTSSDIYNITLPTGFHLGTTTEWATVIQMGINIPAWGPKWGGTFSKYLKLPCAGVKTPGGQMMFVGISGNYYIDNNNTTNALTFDTYNDSTDIQISTSTGTALEPTRLFADTPVVPDSTWVRIY